MLKNRNENPENFNYKKNTYIKEYDEIEEVSKETEEHNSYQRSNEDIDDNYDDKMISNQGQLLSQNEYYISFETLENESINSKNFNNAIEIISNFKITNENWQFKYLSRIDLSLIEDYVYNTKFNWLIIFFKSYDSKLLYLRNNCFCLKNYIVTEIFNDKDAHDYRNISSRNLIKLSRSDLSISELEIKMPFRVKLDILSWISNLLLNY